MNPLLAISPRVSLSRTATADPVRTAAAGAAAFGVGARVSRALAAEPITVGILLPLAGNFAEPGQMTLDGLKIYFDSVGNKAGDRPLNLVPEDEAGDPGTAVSKARKLVERDGAAVVTGLVSSGVTMRVSDHMRNAKVPLVLSGDADDDELTMPGPVQNPLLIRVSENSRAPSAVAADWAYKTKK